METLSLTPKNNSVKKYIYLLLCLCCFKSNAQSVQTTIGSSGKTEVFYDTKMDPADGGSINVGLINDPLSGNGNDLFIVKLNSSQQIVWQKTLSNSGDDIFYKVIVCANGDYVACGHMFVSGVRRAVISRFNSANGNIIWTQRSPSGQGELFWDLVETSSNNIAVVGAESFVSGQTNSFIVLLNSTGTTLWSRVSSTAAADEFRNINQLPNGNLIVAGFYNPSGTFYRLTILELNETTAAIINQNIYNTVPSVTGGPINNSQLSSGIAIRNNNVLLYCLAFQGFGSTSNQCIYTYDQSTKNLSGNIYHKPGKTNVTGFSFYPFSENDFLISQSYATPEPHIGFSRITNGTVVYDKRIDNINLNAIYSTDVSAGNIVSCGSYTSPDATAYNFYSSISIPTETGPCSITNVNTLSLQPVSVASTAQALTSLSVGNSLSNVSITTQDLSYTTNNLCNVVPCNAFTTQTSIGTSTKTETFFDTKIDPSNGAIINAGYINDPVSGNGNDLLLVKLSSTHQLLWQKTIANAGDDIFYKVIVCDNGDYIACGHMFVSGVRRAVAYRINSANGNIIWSSVSNNSASGEIFWDVIETASGNIALAGVDTYVTSQTNSFIVLLNSGGGNLWSRVSSTPLADEFRSIAQLPNGNLLVVGFYNPSTSTYYATISELNETDATILSQNRYNINASVPGGPSQNSLWSGSIYIRNNIVTIPFIAFQGFGGEPNQCIYTYNQTTKNLSGNIYYHTGVSNGNNYTFYAVAENDFLISQGYLSPAPSLTISRITDGAIIFDRKINSPVTALYGIDGLNTEIALGGTINNSGTDAFNIFSETCFPVSIAPCDISNLNTLALQVSNLSATAQSVVSLSPSGALVNNNTAFQDLSYTVDVVCDIIPVTLLNFKGNYNPVTESSLLEWSTATEQNSKSFSVERSVDGGRNFTAIGSVNASGTSNTIVRYQYNDNDPVNGINLYRLKQIDIDNKFKYSNIVSIEVKRKKESYTVYPVPAHGSAFLRSSSTQTKLLNISLIDGAGKMILEQKAYVDTAHPLKLDLATVAPGVYFIKIFSADNTVITKKIIIE